jgi:hypothetical protein
MTCTNLYASFLNASLHELADLVVKGEGKERRLQLVDNFSKFLPFACLTRRVANLDR